MFRVGVLLLLEGTRLQAQNLLMHPIPNSAAPVAAGRIFETTKERIGCRVRLMSLTKAERFSRLTEYILESRYCMPDLGWSGSKAGVEWEDESFNQWTFDIQGHASS